MGGGCGADDDLIWRAVLRPLGGSVALLGKRTVLCADVVGTARVPSSKSVLDRARVYLSVKSGWGGGNGIVGETPRFVSTSASSSTFDRKGEQLAIKAINSD